MAAVYVIVVVTIAAVATSDPHDVHGRLLWFAIALCLPASVPALPFVYVVAALVWNVSNADTSGPGWPITTTYAVLLGLVAATNVVVVRELARRRPRHVRA